MVMDEQFARLPRVLVGPTAAGSTVRHFQIVNGSDGPDWLICKMYNMKTSTASTATYYVAKPWMLRRTPFHNSSFEGISYVYTNNTTRSATNGSNVTIVEVVTPSFGVGAIIKAAQPADGTGVTVGVQPVLWEAEVDRQWAKL